jgi:hypothetical protein
MLNVEQGILNRRNEKILRHSTFPWRKLTDFWLKLALVGLSLLQSPQPHSNCLAEVSEEVTSFSKKAEMRKVLVTCLVFCIVILPVLPNDQDSVIPANI